MIYKKDVDNSSQWATDPLVEIINRCAKFRGVDLDKRLEKRYRRGRYGETKTWSPLRISTSKSRGDGWYTGRCYCNVGKPNPRKSGNIYLGLPHSTYVRNGEEKDREFDNKRFAQVVLHEIDHALGLGHSDMLDSSELEPPVVSDIDVVQKQEK